MLEALFRDIVLNFEDYRRPLNPAPLSPEEKTRLLRDYFESYRRVAESDPDELNVKVTRETFKDLLDEIGCLLIRRSQEMANCAGPMREFLDAHPLPEPLQGRLPDEFRAFCAALNALKQWVAAEQHATDRYLLGGRARHFCSQVAERCLVTGVPLEGSRIELHHPVRDGRPPIPLSKDGHDQIEHKKRIEPDDPQSAAIRRIRNEGNRSWRSLRRGCLRALGTSVPKTTDAVAAGDRSFSNVVVGETGMTCAEILAWLDVRNLGRLPTKS